RLQGQRHRRCDRRQIWRRAPKKDSPVAFAPVRAQVQKKKRNIRPWKRSERFSLALFLLRTDSFRKTGAIAHGNSDGLRLWRSSLGTNWIFIAGSPKRIQVRRTSLSVVPVLA